MPLLSSYNLPEANKEGFHVVVELFQSDRYYVVMTLIYGRSPGNEFPR